MKSVLFLICLISTNAFSQGTTSIPPMQPTGDYAYVGTPVLASILMSTLNQREAACQGTPPRKLGLLDFEVLHQDIEKKTYGECSLDEKKLVACLVNTEVRDVIEALKKKKESFIAHIRSEHKLDRATAEKTVRFYEKLLDHADASKQDPSVSIPE